MRSTTARSVALVPVLCLFAMMALGQSSSAPTLQRFQLKTPPPILHTSPTAAPTTATSNGIQLPVWTYHVVSSRDGKPYEGFIVGRPPDTRGSDASVSVTTQVVPLVFKFESVATGVNLTTGIFETTRGEASSSPTMPDPGCFAGSNRLPLRFLSQSPIFQDADFNFGGTDVGTTQYTDAFQRANFWSVIDKANYHVLLGPVQILSPLVIKVPAAQGFSVPANLFEPSFSMCGPEGLVNLFFVDAVVVKALQNLPGVNPGTFPMFMMYNTAMPIGDPRNLLNCCAGGYHSLTQVGSAFQTYSPFDFDVSGFFISAANDTDIVSHEAGEWMNDPYLINATPPWGNTGQVAGCQNNLEVGDPLTGTNIGRIAMPNGYTYNLQELAFFNWFFGDKPLGIHRWFSDDGTFLTNAGPPCH